MGRLKTNRERNRKKMEKNMKPGQKINIPMKGEVIAPGILPGVKPDNLKNVYCKDCGPEFGKFLPISQLRWAGQFQTTTGQPMLVNFQGGWACTKCGKLNNFEIPGVTDQDEPKPSSG